MALELIQNLSTRKRVQKLLIQIGIIPWIFDKLIEYHKLNETTIEYITALLNNFAFKKKSRSICVKLNPDILSLLVPLLEIENEKIKTHVNGILYSLLLMPELKIKAKVMISKIRKSN